MSIPKEDFYIYIKENDNIIGVSSKNFHHKSPNLLYLPILIFNDKNKQKRYGLPPFFDIILSSKDNSDDILKMYINCYVVECNIITSADDIQILQHVDVYYKDFKEIRCD